MFDETNELVREFRSARDRFEKNGVQDLEIKLKVSRSESGRENHVGSSDEVAGVMVGDMDETDGLRDIIIHSRIKGLERYQIFILNSWLCNILYCFLMSVMDSIKIFHSERRTKNYRREGR